MPEESKKLTINDPVPLEILEALKKLDEARFRIGGNLLDIEQDRVRLLSAAHQVDEQSQRIYEQILMERGLPPTSRVEINTSTGVLTILDSPPQQSPQE